jgi:hypothetical protein
MRLDVLQPDPLGRCHPGQRRHLIQHKVLDLGWSHLHFPPAKADEILEPRVCTDATPFSLRERHGRPHRPRVAGVETAGHVCRRNAVHQGRVLAHRPWPERLAEVGIEIDSHFVLDRPF